MKILQYLQDGTYGLFLRLFVVVPQWMAKFAFLLAVWWFFSESHITYSYQAGYGFYDFFSGFCAMAYGLAFMGWVLHILMYSKRGFSGRVSYMSPTYFSRGAMMNLTSPCVAYVTAKMFISSNGILYFHRASYLLLIGSGFALAYFVCCTFRLGFGLAAVSVGQPAAVPSPQVPSDDPHQNTAGDDVLTVKRPQYDFSSVFGMQDVKNRILRAGLDVLQQRDQKTERNGILLYGGPGNGKTLLAEALAGELNVKLCLIEFGRINGQWVGLKTTRLRKAFDLVRSQAPCVLFIDEIDSFIRSGEGMHWRSEENEQIVNFFLTELVNIRGAGVIVMGATNKLEQLDARAIREGRFDFKIEIPCPDAQARLKILHASIKANVPALRVVESELKFASDRWNGFNVKRLQSVGEELRDLAHDVGLRQVGYRELLASLRRIQGKEGYKRPDAKGFDDLTFPEQTSSALRMISTRISDPYKFESHGGTIPNGILFTGPTGTGKTASAGALALESGWHFLSVAGPDLLKDVAKLDDLFQQACSNRPAIIFIDEADEILRERRYSQNSALTNKLLTIMDGAGEKVKDVIFVAATNNPDLIDPACLRSGRFTEKVPFFAATGAMSASIISDWMNKKRAHFDFSLSIDEACEMMEGFSPANIEGVLQYALNSAIADSPAGKAPITRRQVEIAISIVN